MEVEADTHVEQWLASQNDTETTHAIILRDSMSLLRKVKFKMADTWPSIAFGCKTIP